MRGFSHCHGEGWVHIYSHHKISGKLLWHVCATGFNLGSSKPDNYTVLEQSRGTRTPPSPLIYCSDLPCRGFDALQWVLCSDVACTGVDAGQRPSPVIILDAVTLYWGWKCLVVASTCQLASWPEWILAVLNLLIKMYLYATDQDSALQLCSGIFLFSDWFNGQGIFSVHFVLFFFFAEVILQTASFLSCWCQPIRPSFYSCQMAGVRWAILLYICRLLIRRQEWFRPDQINNGNRGITRSCPCPCHAWPPTQGTSNLNCRVEPVLYN